MADQAIAATWRGPLHLLGRDRFEAPGGAILIEDRSNLAKFLLRGGPNDGAFLAATQAALGLDLPQESNRSAATGGTTAYWTQPDEWLVTAEPGQAEPLAEALAAANLVFTEVSDGRAAFRLSGPRSRDLLKKGTSLNLHPRRFQPGHCAQSQLAQASVLLARPAAGEAAPLYDIFCERSFAEYLWLWLEDAAAEFGAIGSRGATPKAAGPPA